MTGAITLSYLVERIGRKWMMAAPLVLLGLITFLIAAVSTNRSASFEILLSVFKRALRSTDIKKK